MENRNKYLKHTEIKLKSSIEKVLAQISRLEEERSKIYKVLEEKGALSSITNTFEQLVIERSKMQANLQTLQEIDSLQEKLGNEDVVISEIKRDLIKDLKDQEESTNQLRQLFQSILKNAIFLGEDYSNAYFDISIRTKSRRHELPFQIEVEVPKVDALGQARLKIVAYDLMIFLNNIRQRRNIVNFLIHDGVFCAFHSIRQVIPISNRQFIPIQFVSP